MPEPQACPFCLSPLDASVIIAPAACPYCGLMIECQTDALTVGLVLLSPTGTHGEQFMRNLQTYLSEASSTRATITPAKPKIFDQSLSIPTENMSASGAKWIRVYLVGSSSANPQSWAILANCAAVILYVSAKHIPSDLEQLEPLVRYKAATAAVRIDKGVGTCFFVLAECDDLGESSLRSSNETRKDHLCSMNKGRLQNLVVNVEDTFSSVEYVFLESDAGTSCNTLSWSHLVSRLWKASEVASPHALARLHHASRQEMKEQ